MTHLKLLWFQEKGIGLQNFRKLKVIVVREGHGLKKLNV